MEPRLQDQVPHHYRATEREREAVGTGGAVLRAGLPSDSGGRSSEGVVVAVHAADAEQVTGERGGRKHAGLGEEGGLRCGEQEWEQKALHDGFLDDAKWVCELEAWTGRRGIRYQHAVVYSRGI
jgi:hypothetical protein